MTEEHPLRKELREWLPEFDFGVMRHGFAPHGRDYVFVLQQAAGTFELTVTHVVEFHFETRVPDEAWPNSWDDRLTNYSTAYDPGVPSGYIWGTNWTMAFPGLGLPDEDPTAAQWSERLGKKMFAMSLETDGFRIWLVFHEARSRKLSEDAAVIGQVIFPLGSPPKTDPPGS